MRLVQLQQEPSDGLLIFNKFKLLEERAEDSMETQSDRPWHADLGNEKQIQEDLRRNETLASQDDTILSDILQEGNGLVLENIRMPKTSRTAREQNTNRI